MNPVISPMVGEIIKTPRLQAVVSGTDVGITRQLLPSDNGTSELREAHAFFEAGGDVETVDGRVYAVYMS